MAYTSPTTRSTGNSISAAQWNADMVDNVKWLAGDSSGKPSCRVYNSANIAVTTATWTSLTFDSEQYDVGGLHSTSSNTSRFTIPSGGAGKYTFKGCCEFAANSTGARAIRILLGGTVTLWQDSRPTVPSASGTTVMNIACDYALTVGEYVELQVFQDSGGNLNALATANYSPYFSAMWLAL